MEYSSAFHGCSFRVMVSTDWLALGQGVINYEAGPDVSHGNTSLGFAAFLGLELKHN